MMSVVPRFGTLQSQVDLYDYDSDNDEEFEKSPSPLRPPKNQSKSSGSNGNTMEINPHKQQKQQLIQKEKEKEKQRAKEMEMEMEIEKLQMEDELRQSRVADDAGFHDHHIQGEFDSQNQHQSLTRDHPEGSLVYQQRDEIREQEHNPSLEFFQNEQQQMFELEKQKLKKERIKLKALENSGQPRASKGASSGGLIKSASQPLPTIPPTQQQKQQEEQQQNTKQLHQQLQIQIQEQIQLQIEQQVQYHLEKQRQQLHLQQYQQQQRHDDENNTFLDTNTLSQLHGVLPDDDQSTRINIDDANTEEMDQLPYPTNGDIFSSLHQLNRRLNEIENRMEQIAGNSIESNSGNDISASNSNSIGVNKPSTVSPRIKRISSRTPSPKVVPMSQSAFSSKKIMRIGSNSALANHGTPTKSKRLATTTASARKKNSKMVDMKTFITRRLYQDTMWAINDTGPGRFFLFAFVVVYMSNKYFSLAIFGLIGILYGGHSYLKSLSR